jgi:hypothetical protein
MERDFLRENEEKKKKETEIADVACLLRWIGLHVQRTRLVGMVFLVI